MHRAELLALQGADVAIVVASPGCYPTTALLGLYPLARAGLIEDVVVDAKSGVSGAGRELKAELTFAEVNDRYGLRRQRASPRRSSWSRSSRLPAVTPEANPGAATVGFLPHLVPMNAGILPPATCGRPGR